MSFANTVQYSTVKSSLDRCALLVFTIHNDTRVVLDGSCVTFFFKWIDVMDHATTDRPIDDGIDRLDADGGGCENTRIRPRILDPT